jgi:hypothetical protein
LSPNDLRYKIKNQKLTREELLGLSKTGRTYENSGVLAIPNMPPQALDLYVPPPQPANIPPQRVTNPNTSVPSRLLPSVAGEFVPELAGRLTRRRELTLDNFLTDASCHAQVSTRECPTRTSRAGT